MTQMDQDRRQALAGRAYCSECHSTMLRMGPDYICPSRVNPTAESCTTNSVNASGLLRLVATHIVGTVMTKPTIDRLAQRIQEDAQETSRRFQKQLDQTEDSLNELTLQDLNRLGLNLYFIEEEAEKNSRNNRNQQMDPNDISNKRTALAYEARNARRELDAQAFISDEARARANAKNVDTFLDDAPPEVTNEFIENFVKSVGVGTRSIDLNYKFPIPSPDFPEGKLTYVIPRSGSDLTGVIDAGPEEPPQTPTTPLPTGKTNGNL